MNRLGTLQQLIAGLRSHGNRTALLALHAAEPEQWSFLELAENVERLATGLVTAGLRPGEPVLLLAKNRPEWIVACLATIAAGGVTLPLDSQIADAALGHVLRDSGARWVFTTTEFLSRLGRLGLPELPRTLLLDVPREDSRSWRALQNGGLSQLPALQPADPAALFYTSGTTGVPKGVPLSHANLTFQIDSLLATDLVRPDDVVLLPLPLYHTYPFSLGMLLPLTAGLPIVLPAGITGPQIIRAVEVGKPTIIIGVPRLLRALFNGIESQAQAGGRLTAGVFKNALRLSDAGRRRFGLKLGRRLLGRVHRRFGPQLRMLTSGGSALDPELGASLQALGWDVAIGYGLTETAPLLTANLPGSGRDGSVGKPLDGVEIRVEPVASAETSDPGVAASASQEGEILARGPNIFAGYRNLPDQTAQVFTPDGWFRTGDLGYFDADGYLFITGRASTLIVTEGGKKIQPDPLEDLYAEQPAIKEIGILQRDGKLVAVIVPDLEEVNKLTNGDIPAAIRVALAAASKSLPQYQRVVDYAVSQEELPRTNLGKIRRHQLVELYDRARQGLAQESNEPKGPLPIEDMSEQDRALLEHPAARQVWEWLARRYPDRRLTPDTSPQLDLGVDSLAWLSMTLEISQRTGVELSEEAIARVATVRDLLQEVNRAEASGAPAMSAVEHPESVLTPEQLRHLQPVSPIVEWLGVLLYLLNRFLARRIYKVHYSGVENLPDHTNYVLTPNHLSYLDVFTIAGGLDYRRVRNTYWAGAVDVMFTNRFMTSFSRIAQVVPITGDRGTGRSSLAFGSLILKRRKNMVWFPEGRLSPTGELLPFREGLGLVLSHHPTLVVPVHLRGQNEALPRGHVIPRRIPLYVTFGKPVDTRELAKEGSGENEATRIVAALRERVAALAAQPVAQI